MCLYKEKIHIHVKEMYWYAGKEVYIYVLEVCRSVEIREYVKEIYECLDEFREYAQRDRGTGVFVQKIHIRVNQTYSYVKRDVYIRAWGLLWCWHSRVCNRDIDNIFVHFASAKEAQGAGVYVKNIHIYVKETMCKYKMTYIYVIEVFFGGETREYVTEV